MAFVSISPRWPIKKIDGNQDTIKSTSWTTRYVQAIVDENLIYGSTLKITYK